METPHATDIEGIKCFAPDLAKSCADYPKEAFARLAEIEDIHFWFRSRNAVIAHLVEKYLNSKAAHRRFLEIGCGSGYVLKMLSTLPGLKCTGGEIHLNGALLAKARAPAAEIVQFDASDLPFKECFDAVGAFDVVEHIQTDEIVMRNVHRALKPGGCFFLTVPQHRFLWSLQDKLAGHKRRYTKSELIAKLTRSGFRVDFVGSFCCVLFPLMVLSRLTRRDPAKAERERTTLAQFNISAGLHRVLRALMRVDELLHQARLESAIWWLIDCCRPKADGLTHPLPVL